MRFALGVRGPLSLMVSATLFMGLASAGIGQRSASPASGAPKGGEIFTARCAACHSSETGVQRLGPSLAGVVGRPVGTAPGFRYSPAMLGSGLVWTPQNLDRFLAAPAQTVPRNRMAYAGLASGQDRKDLIAYLSTLP